MLLPGVLEHQLDTFALFAVAWNPFLVIAEGPLGHRTRLAAVILDADDARTIHKLDGPLWHP